MWIDPVAKWDLAARVLISRLVRRKEIPMKSRPPRPSATRFGLSSVAALTGVVLLVSGLALAVHDLDLFELEGMALA